MNYKEKQEKAQIALELYREYQEMISTHISQWYKEEELNKFDRFCDNRISQMDAYMAWYRPL